MYRKVIVSIVLIALAGVHIVNSLTCFACNNYDQCQNPSVVTCSGAQVNATNNALRVYSSTVPSVFNMNFYCINATWTQKYSNNNNKYLRVAGCTYANNQTCPFLTLKPEYQTPEWSSSCTTCSSDKCNGNSASMIGSRSAFLAFASSLIAIIVAKALKF